jgi:hypothetical protein
MRETQTRRALIAAAALAFVAGCSGNSASLAPGQPSSVMPSSRQVQSAMRRVPGSAVEGAYQVPLVPHPWNLPHVWPDMGPLPQVLFVADPQNNQVLMYDPKTPNPSPSGSITDGIEYPFGVAVDKKGTLYVANLLGGSPNIGSITIYPSGSSSPSVTITNGVSNPYGIAVDSKGDIFAANLGNDTIVGYKPHKTKPFETIGFNAFGQALGVGVDGLNNIWIGSDTTNQVWEIPAGSSTPQNAGLSGLNGTINVAFGKQDVMYVSNFSGSNVQVYAYGTTTPSETITKGIEIGGPTLGGFTSSGYYFQSNQNGNVSGYKKGRTSPFSTITGIPDPRGIASTPLIKK